MNSSIDISMNADTTFAALNNHGAPQSAESVQQVMSPAADYFHITMELWSKLGVEARFKDFQKRLDDGSNSSAWAEEVMSIIELTDYL